MAKATKKPETENEGLHESRNILIAGVTVSDIAIIFAKDRREITSKIAGNVAPVGQRGNAPTYLIRDVAPYFVNFLGDIEGHIKRMRPEDLPPKLQKAYYDGLKGRQDYEVREGRLWPQDKIIEVFSAAVKIVRTNLLLLPEEVGRQTELTEDQKSRLRAVIASVMAKMQQQLFAELAPMEPKKIGEDEERDDKPDIGAGQESEPVVVIDDLDERIRGL